ncbi:MAG TPA: hypothetical protein VGX28_00985 [Frankiaceae bacterium]|jgi:hypothetical protein|nr:hypothetical protein [Frankiaceae bacterium]
MTESDFRTDDARDEAETSSAIDEAVQGRDPGPIDEEAMQAAEGLTAPPEVGEHHREMDQIGANVQGEGQVP